MDGTVIHAPPVDGIEINAALRYTDSRARSELRVEVVGLIGRSVWIPRRHARVLLALAWKYLRDDEARGEDRGLATKEELAELYRKVSHSDEVRNTIALVHYVSELESSVRNELRGDSELDLPPIRLIKTGRNAGYRLACRLSVDPSLPEIIL